MKPYKLGDVVILSAGTSLPGRHAVIAEVHSSVYSIARIFTYHVALLPSNSLDYWLFVLPDMIEGKLDPHVARLLYGDLS